jgi:ribosomal protein S18 acetylase RimI-like enzyme
MPIAFNALETKRFGIRCASVVDPQASLEAVNAAAQFEGIAFLSVRVPTDDISRVQALEDDGYRLMDTIVYYHKYLSNRHLQTPKLNDIDIRIAELHEAERVGEVAAAAFSNYFGHFHADARLSQTACDAVYVDWAKNCVRMQVTSLPVLVAQTSENIVGFLCARHTDDTCADIALNAVMPGMQGQGIYGALLDNSLLRMAAAGFQEVTISTQVNNTRVQRACGKRGFRMQRSSYTLHKWMHPAHN